MTAISRVDEDGNYKYKPKRDSNGIIQCLSQLDKEACRYADKMRALRQQEYNTAVVYSDREQEMIAQNERSEQDFIVYFNRIIYKCHPNSLKSIIVNWTRVGKLLSIYSKDKPIPFKTISVKFLEDIKLLMLTSPMGGNKKGTLSKDSTATYFSRVKASLHRAFVDEHLTVDISTKVKGIPEVKVKWEYLTIEEAGKLANMPYDNEILKRTFFFAVQDLTWGEISKVQNGWQVDFTQRKTYIVDYLQSTSKPIHYAENGVNATSAYSKGWQVLLGFPVHWRNGLRHLALRRISYSMSEGIEKFVNIK